MTSASPEEVLSTLRSDGSRRWLKPRLSKGRFLNRRRIVAYFLMALFFVLPFLKAHGKPLVLLDIVHRRFTIMGYTFLPTDTILLALFMLFIFVSIFLFTAVFGRLWCGWACPQTVYLEFLYRPLERLFEGTAGRGGMSRSISIGRKAGFFFAALLVTFIPAHTFLAYFVGVDALALWVRQSPLAHPTAFFVMVITTGLMFFDFYWFREQMCLIACPYGRLQSVLLDRVSLIVMYDRRRGEPRGKVRGDGKGKSHSSAVIDGPAPSQTAGFGDCVDCTMCVTTCPTGIDIRDGLQMECVNCTQCVDACDAVMDKVGRPRGLIRYSSQAALEGSGGKIRRFRFRLVFYPVILCILTAVWLVLFVNKGSADVTVLRNRGTPFTLLASGQVANPMRLKVQNRTDAEALYRFDLLGLTGGKIDTDENPLKVAAGESRTVGFIVEAPASAFALGMRDVKLQVSDGRDFNLIVPLRLIGSFEVRPALEEPKEEPATQAGAQP